MQTPLPDPPPSSAGSPPAMVDNSYNRKTGVADRPAEAAVWILNDASDRLTAQWINSDGTKPATTLAYLTTDRVMVLTGDIEALRATYSDGANQVRAVELRYQRRRIQSYEERVEYAAA
ncbi:unnamed protein product [Zymoseptoria tritici ST99CH_1E4]|uniref:Uncharacterized protein n=1 Tax=Zymoseptoria tritici ST99CH_1E4 TaxID=1276532 RepID=A0A2H1G4T7_ZYMTR|nr:unnamed protein product [Zymoseptoria tritici ST99CH_1E4]